MPRLLDHKFSKLSNSWGCSCGWTVSDPSMGIDRAKKEYSPHFRYFLEERKTYCRECKSHKTTAEMAHPGECTVCRSIRHKGYEQTPKTLEARRARHLVKTYGITPEEWDEMLANQNGACAICMTPQTTRKLHTDHDHRTGKIRGLLCTNCNHAIGALMDDPDLLRSAIQYLESGE